MKKKGFTLIELLAVIIVLAIVALIATPIILNVVEDSKKSAAESEANMVLQGLTSYCNNENFKVQAGTLNEEDKKCNKLNKEAVIKELVPNMSNTTKIENVKYENGKITSLKVESNGYTYELNENGIMVNTDSEIEGIKIAANPTHNLYLFGETFLIDSNTTWQQLIDGSNGKLTSSIEYGDLLTINGHCLKFFSNGDENGGMPNLYESNLSSKIVSKFGNKSPLDGGDFALSDWSNSIVCPSIPDDGSTYCQVDFEYALEQDSNNVAYIESLS